MQALVYFAACISSCNFPRKVTYFGSKWSYYYYWFCFRAWVAFPQLESISPHSWKLILYLGNSIGYTLQYIVNPFRWRNGIIFLDLEVDRGMNELRIHTRLVGANLTFRNCQCLLSFPVYLLRTFSFTWFLSSLLPAGGAISFILLS